MVQPDLHAETEGHMTSSLGRDKCVFMCFTSGLLEHKDLNTHTHTHIYLSCSTTTGHCAALFTIPAPLIQRLLREQIRQIRSSTGPTVARAKLLYWDTGI